MLKVEWEYSESHDKEHRWFMCINGKIISENKYDTEESTDYEVKKLHGKDMPLIIIRLDNYFSVEPYVLYSSGLKCPPAQKDNTYGYMTYNSLSLAKYDAINWYFLSLKEGIYIRKEV